MGQITVRAYVNQTKIVAYKVGSVWAEIRNDNSPLVMVTMSVEEAADYARRLTDALNWIALQPQDSKEF